MDTGHRARKSFWPARIWRMSWHETSLVHWFQMSQTSLQQTFRKIQMSLGEGIPHGVLPVGSYFCAPIRRYTESHQTYRTIHHTSNNANTCTKCKASVKGSSPSHVSIVLSTTQPGLRQQCYEKPTPLWNPPPGKAHQQKQNTSTHTHIKKFCCGRYKASQQRNDSKSQARSQRQSLLPTTCGRSFDRASSETLSLLIQITQISSRWTGHNNW